MTANSASHSPFSGAALLAAVQAKAAQDRIVPSTTNRRTRAIEPVVRAHGLTVWMGGRTAGDVTEHGVIVPDDKTLLDVQAVINELAWPGVTMRVEGRNPSRKRMGDAFVVWLQVPRH
jgi:hypothetical protein